MKFIVEVDIMPQKALLDPQGKAVNQSIDKIGFTSIKDVRIGKHIVFNIEADSKKEAEKTVEEVSAKILSNPIMEGYKFTLTEV